MNELVTEGVVLRQVDYKESDRILTLLTPEHGLITVSARGVRSIKSKNSPAVQLFSYSEFELMQKNARYSLRTAYLKDGFFTLSSDIQRYALACYVAQTLLHFCTEENNEVEPFRLALNVFYALANAKEKPLSLIKAAYELKLCTVCGFMPELGGCCVCGKPLSHEPIPDGDFLIDGKYRYSLMESGLICKNCYEKAHPPLSEASAFANAPIPKDYTRALSATAARAAHFVVTSPLSRFLSFRLHEADATGLGELAEQNLLFLAERGFDTLKYYKSL